MTRKKAPVCRIRSAWESKKVLGAPDSPAVAGRRVVLTFIQVSAPVFTRCTTESWFLLDTWS